MDAQGHGIISAKIASTVHDTFHALMLAELDRNGKTTPDMFEKINLRLAQSVTARNALGGIKMTIRAKSRPCSTVRYARWTFPLRKFRPPAAVGILRGIRTVHGDR